MALLSKFLHDFGNTTGIPAIGISRAVYSAAILGYFYNVALPHFKKLGSNKKPKQKEEIENTDENTEVLARQISQIQEKKKPKGPAVNKYINY